MYYDELEKLNLLYLRVNCIGFTFIVFLTVRGMDFLSSLTTALPAIIYQFYYVVIISFNIKYIMEDELSPPRSNHK